MHFGGNLQPDGAIDQHFLLGSTMMNWLALIFVDLHLALFPHMWLSSQWGVFSQITVWNKTACAQMIPQLKGYNYLEIKTMFPTEMLC